MLEGCAEMDYSWVGEGEGVDSQTELGGRRGKRENVVGVVMMVVHGKTRDRFPGVFISSGEPHMSVWDDYSRRRVPGVALRAPHLIF